jgi:hypothetical protein
MLTNNAITWAHFQLRGGWKSLIVTSSFYGTAILVLIFITTRMNSTGSTSTTAGWAGVIMGLQAAALLLFAGSRISHAIRNDLNSSIIESHRLMPLPPWQAIVGYMTGPSGQALGVVAVNLLLGVGIVSMASLGLYEWFAANGVLLSFSVFIWAVLVLMSFVTRKAFGGIGWVIGLTVFGFSTQGMITMLLPGVAVLASPVMGQTVFSLRPGALALGPNYALAIAGQGVIGALCFVGAARKYRRADEAAFTPFMGLLLLAAWVGVSLVGMAHWRDVAPWVIRRAFGDDDEVRPVQFIASTLMAMLVALIPIAAASRAHLEWKRKQRLADPALLEPRGGPSRWLRRPMAPLAVTLLAAGLCLCLLVTMPVPGDLAELIWRQPMNSDQERGMKSLLAAIVITATVVVSFAMTMSCLLRTLHRGGARRTAVFAGVLIPLLWVGPILIDVARWVAVQQQDDRAPLMTRLSTASPIGALVMTWGNMRDRYRVSPVPGVVVQAALAVTMTALYYGTGRRRHLQPQRSQ